MSTTAKDIMSTEVLKITRDTTLEEALKILVNRQITGVPVVDAKGKMVGVLSDFDVLSQVATAKKLDPQVFQDPVRYTSKVDAIQEGTPLQEILLKFIQKKYRRLPVLNKSGKLVGIVSRRDLIRLYFYRSKLS